MLERGDKGEIKEIVESQRRDDGGERGVGEDHKKRMRG